MPSKRSTTSYEVPPSHEVEPPRISSSSSGVVVLLAVILAIVAAGFAATAYFQYQDLESIRGLQAKTAGLESAAEVLFDMPQRSELTRIEEAMAALEIRVQAIEERDRQGDSSLGESAQRELQLLGERLDSEISEAADSAAQALRRVVTLDEEARSDIGRIESEGAKALESAVALLSERIGQLERAQTSARQTTPTGAVALAQLSVAVQGTAPFPEVLNAFEQVTGRGMSAEFHIAAREGMPDISLLLAAFREAIRDLARERAKAKDTKAPLDRFRAWAGGLVTIRPSSAVAGDDERSIVSRAEARMAEGHLAEAITELESLPRPRAAQWENWLRSARLRLHVESELNRILAELTAEAS